MVTCGRPKGNSGEGLEKCSSTVRERSVSYPRVRWYSGNQRRGQRAAGAVCPWWSTWRQEKNSTMVLSEESWQVVARVDAWGCYHDIRPLEEVLVDGSRAEQSNGDERNRAGRVGA
jgi:hypothetical protein